MKHVKWLNLYLVVLGVSLASMGLTVYALRQFLTLEELFVFYNGHVPFVIYIGGMLLLLSAGVSIGLFYNFKQQQRHILQKLQWLYLGNYSHPIFSRHSNQRFTLNYYLHYIDEKVADLRGKLIALSAELQQQLASPSRLHVEEREQILEEERHRIACELYDSVSQQLFAAMMMLSAMNATAQTENEALKKQLSLVERIINDSQTEMRALLLHLRPIKLEGKSLQQGVQQLLKELDGKVHIAVTSNVGDIVTRTGVEDHLFRIIQELVSNVLRHARAHTLDVYLAQSEDSIRLRVQDDGIGFDTSQQKMGSYGLPNIEERVKSMGGQFKIVSKQAVGTVVELSIPNVLQANRTEEADD